MSFAPRCISLNKRDIIQEGKIRNSDLIELLNIVQSKDGSLIVGPGIGLDASIIKFDSELVCFSTDPITLCNKNIVYHCISVNINDVACLGYRPVYCMIELILPIGTTYDYIKQLFIDISIELKKYGIVAIGGHTEISSVVNSPLMIAQMIGKKESKNILDIRNCTDEDYVILCKKLAIEGSIIYMYDEKILSMFNEEEITEMKDELDKTDLCIYNVAKRIYDIDGIVAIHDITEGGISLALSEISYVSSLHIESNIEHMDDIYMKCTKKISKKLNIDMNSMLGSGSFLAICKKYAIDSIMDIMHSSNVDCFVINK